MPDGEEGMEEGREDVKGGRMWRERGCGGREEVETFE